MHLYLCVPCFVTGVFSVCVQLRQHTQEWSALWLPTLKSPSPELRNKLLQQARIQCLIQDRAAGDRVLPAPDCLLYSCLHPAAVHFVILLALTLLRVFLPICCFHRYETTRHQGVQGYPDWSCDLKLCLTVVLSLPGLHRNTTVKVSVAVSRPASAGVASIHQGFGHREKACLQVRSGRQTSDCEHGQCRRRWIHERIDRLIRKIILHKQFLHILRDGDILN